MERWKIILAFYKGVLSEDLGSSDIGSGVSVNRVKEIDYDTSGGDVIEITLDKLQVFYNNTISNEITLTEAEIGVIDSEISNIMENGYISYITEKMVNKF